MNKADNVYCVLNESIAFSVVFFSFITIQIKVRLSHDSQYSYATVATSNSEKNFQIWAAQSPPAGVFSRGNHLGAQLHDI